METNDQASEQYPGFREAVLGATALHVFDDGGAYGNAPTAPAFDREVEDGAYVRGTE